MTFRRYCRVRFHVERVTWRGDGVERVVVARRCALLCGRGGKHLLLETTAVPLIVGRGGEEGEGARFAGKVGRASVRQKRGFPVPGWVDTSTVGRAWRRAGTGEVVPGFLFAECVPAQDVEDDERRRRRRIDDDDEGGWGGAGRRGVRRGVRSVWRERKTRVKEGSEGVDTSEGVRATPISAHRFSAPQQLEDGLTF